MVARHIHPDATGSRVPDELPSSVRHKPERMARAPNGRDQPRNFCDLRINPMPQHLIIVCHADDPRKAGHLAQSKRRSSMKTLILAAIAALSLGLGVANAASTPVQQGNQYNFLAGGGG
jgi:hypothetical protein